MKHATLLFLLLMSTRLIAQGWVWQAGSPDQHETLHLIWADTDSTVVCVGDSANLIIWKQLNHQGEVLVTKSTVNIFSDLYDAEFDKKDFGFSVVARKSHQTSWTTYVSSNYYQLFDAAGNPFAGGLVNGQNGNDYTVQDALLTPDSAVLVIGAHLNPDGNKLYLQKAYSHPEHPGNWTKEIHDSTKNILGVRIFPVANHRYLLLAMRSGNFGTTVFGEIGFLLINDTGDLLESNWVPQSGTFNQFSIGHIATGVAVSQDADGFSIARKDNLYHFDSLGHLLWTKPINLSFDPLNLRRSNDGFIVCGYEYHASPAYELGVAKLDPSGTLIWQREYNWQVHEEWRDIVPIADGYITVGYISNPANEYNRDYFAVKLNEDGSILRNNVNGYAFNDANANCLRDTNEPGIGGLSVSFDNSYFLYPAFTDSTGYFEIVADTGHYVLQLSHPPGAYWTACVDSLTGYLPDVNMTDTLYVPFQPTALCPQMRIDLEANRVRPCSSAVACLRWQNIGTVPADSVTIVLTLPDNAELTDTQLPATDLGGGQYLFNLGTVAVGTSGQAAITITGDCGLQIGDFVCLQARIFPDAICDTPQPPDSTTFQFSQDRCLEVRNSFDPNDKSAEPAGRGDFQYIPLHTELTYLIRFQNTGNDTAFRVVIRDTLSAHLDPFSIRPEIASHSFRMEFQEDGSLKFVFEQILLPDSTTNEPASHGFIRFKAKLRPNPLPLTAIHNRAAIYFDHNPPVLTNTVLRTIEPGLAGTALPDGFFPQVDISPNPAHSVFSLRLGLERAAEAQLTVYDLAGRVVHTVLPVRLLAAGPHWFHVPADSWPKGVYLLEIQSNQYKTVRKLVKQ